MTFNMALLKHAVSRQHAIIRTSKQDLERAQAALFAALDTNDSAFAIISTASNYYQAHRSTVAAAAFVDAIGHTGRSWSSASTALEDTERIASAFDALESVAPHLVHVKCPCPNCAEPERERPDDAPMITRTDLDDAIPF